MDEPSPPPRRSWGVAAVAAVAVTALLAVAVLASRALPSGVNRPRPLVIDPPLGWLPWVVGAVLLLLAAFVLWVLWPDAGEEWRPPARRSLWPMLLFVAAAVAILALDPSIDLRVPGLDQPSTSVGERQPRSPGAPQERGSPWPLAVVVMALLAAAVGFVAGRRPDEADDQPDDVLPDSLEQAASPPFHAVASASGRDARAAVIAAYAAFEQVLASRHLPRRIPEAPREYLERISRRCPSVAGPAQDLTRLYEAARFDRRPCTPEGASRAQTALAAVRDRLEVRAR